MGYKINVDRYGFAKKPEPEKVSRDYAAEYAKSLVEKEANIRNTRDIELHNEIIAEGNARRTDKAELQSEIASEKTERENAINQEIENRNDAISEAIDEEARMRTNMIHQFHIWEGNARDEAIKKEVSDRNNAISTAISKEVANRNDAIDHMIKQEENARNTKDEELEAEIEALKQSGGGNVDLSGYYTKQEIDYFNKEINSSINDKADMGFVLGNLAGKADASDVDLAIGRINEKIGDIDSALGKIISLQVAKGGDAV